MDAKLRELIEAKCPARIPVEDWVENVVRFAEWNGGISYLGAANILRAVDDAYLGEKKE